MDETIYSSLPENSLVFFCYFESLIIVLSHLTILSAPVEYTSKVLKFLVSKWEPQRNPYS